jgi:hypothetical protein
MPCPVAQYAREDKEIESIGGDGQARGRAPEPGRSPGCAVAVGWIPSARPWSWSARKPMSWLERPCFCRLEGWHEGEGNKEELRERSAGCFTN